MKIPMNVSILMSLDNLFTWIYMPYAIKFIYNFVLK